MEDEFRCLQAGAPEWKIKYNRWFDTQDALSVSSHGSSDLSDEDDSDPDKRTRSITREDLLVSPVQYVPVRCHPDVVHGVHLPSLKTTEKEFPSKTDCAILSINGVVKSFTRLHDLSASDK